MICLQLVSPGPSGCENQFLLIYHKQASGRGSFQAFCFTLKPSSVKHSVDSKTTLYKYKVCQVAQLSFYSLYYEHGIHFCHH